MQERINVVDLDSILSEQMVSEGCPNSGENLMVVDVTKTEVQTVKISNDALDRVLSEQMVSEGCPNSGSNVQEVVMASGKVA